MVYWFVFRTFLSITFISRAFFIYHKSKKTTFNLTPPKPVPSVERWTPGGERTRPGKKGPGFEARRALDTYEPPGGYCYGWWQAVAR